MARSTAVLPYNLGLYYNRSPLAVPIRALADGRNFRIHNGQVSNTSLGWAPWSAALGTNSALTKVLLHFDGADASTIIHDSAVGQSGPPWRVWTANGNAALDTAQQQFGTASLLLDGTGDFASHAHDADFVLGSSEWAISAWVFPDADGTIERIAGKGLSGLAAADTEWYMERQADNLIHAFVSNGSAFTELVSTTTVLTGDFRHVLLSFKGGVLSLAVAGTVEDSAAFVGPVNSVVTADLAVGQAGEDTTNPFDGWIDEFALQVGTGTGIDADFNVPTAEFQPVLNGPIMLIEEFASRGEVSVHVVATTRDIYVYDTEADQFRFISPQYNVATVDVSAADPAVVTVDTGTPNWITNGIKQGDQIIFNTTAESQPDAAWYEIASVDAEDELTLTTAVTGAPLNAVAYTIRRRFTGNIQNRWDVEIFVAPNDGVEDDMLFLTNGQEDVVTWTVQEAFAEFHPELGFRCRQLRIFKSMMLYGNLIIAGDEFPTSFINSDVGIPLDVAGGLAGEFRVHDGTDQILEMEDLGDNMVFYSARHLTLAQFVGDPLIFIFRQASTGIGPLGSQLVADFGDYHEFLGEDSQYLFDGVSVNEVGTQVWREVLRSRDASRQTLGFIHFDEENGDLIWAIPLADDDGTGDVEAPPEEAFVEHYLEIEEETIPDPVSRRAMPFICGGYAVSQDILSWDEVEGTWEDQTVRWNDSVLGAAFPINLMGGEDGIIYVINVAQTGNGTILPSFIRSGRRVMLDGRERGMLRRVYPFASELVGDLSVITRYSDHANGPTTITETNLFDLALPQEGHFVTPYRRGRYFEVEFQRNDGQPYELEGYDIDIYRGGTR